MAANRAVFVPWSKLAGQIATVPRPCACACAAELAIQHINPAAITATLAFVIKVFISLFLSALKALDLLSTSDNFNSNVRRDVRRMGSRKGGLSGRQIACP